MQGLRTAQRQYDRRLPDEGRQRAEREFEHPEFPPAGANVIRSSKFFDFKTSVQSAPGAEINRPVLSTVSGATEYSEA